MKSKKLQIAILVLIVTVMILFMSTGIIIDIQWFKEVGYLNVFLTKIIAVSKLLIPIFIIYFITLWLYLKTFNKGILNIIGINKIKKVKRISLLVSILIAFIGSIKTSLSHWYKILQFSNSVDFNKVDPIFNKDVSFYIFKLPLIQSIYSAILMLLIIMVIITLVIYFILNIKEKVLKSDNIIHINTSDRLKNFAGKQLAIVSAVLIIVIGVGYILRAFDLVYSTRGVAYGASYTDVKVTLNFYKVITIACFIASIIVFFSLLKSKFKLIVISIATVGVLIVLEPVTAIIVQQFIVNPNEMELEKKYIKYNIDSTKEAFNIANIEEKNFEPQNELDIQQLTNNQDIIDNLKVNSTEPVLNFYQQVQLIKNYYEFNDTDTDRYNINGQYSQVFISPREINRDSMTTWQNKHLRYTHGYGLAMSKVNEVTKEGQPSFVMKDIPTINSTNINLQNPRIYYGEGDNEYVIVNTDVEEFDYPTGDTESVFKYDGTGGIKMSFLNRILFSIYEKNPKILFSGSINENSKLILNTNIVKRAKKIAPFLQYDSDPYVVVNDGQLFWIMDAYTVSNKYPFSEPYSGVNYIRNSIKVVIDAYNGNVDFYIVDKNDPIAESYSKIFKGLFKSLDKMPEKLKDHFKYPQDIFKLQSEVLAKYHTNDPIKLFTQEDLWDKSRGLIDEEIKSKDEGNIIGIKNENTLKTKENNKEGLYLMTRLPGEKKLEMMLFEYFNMKGKQSMVALLGARMDGENYGQLIMYKFPPQRTIYSPNLFKNRIQQNPEISKEVSLWAGKGSEVVYGDIVIVPIEDSLLYLNTIYLKADDENSMPEMKRVILSNGDKIVIEENIDKALQKLFNYNIDNVEINIDNTNIEEDEYGNIKNASDLFKKAMEAQKSGDWARYGEYINSLGNLLEELSK
ncbi:UPF0182 family protein [Clostridium tarantellae]|uniref:UPF0182 protein GBZ86_12945 n=1 Tax=Clostridium tarantellae TaxID=39493 RepID=A0A6I1MNN2_9CLOT|nr:UPF0182 family protein [Clostridium tarantellae]MPQ44644.1 hypothetical protein [Clostridium tarantellae]